MKTPPERMQPPSLNVVVPALLALALSGCYRVRSQLISTPTPPAELYRCAQLEIARAGYAIVGADRASGWLRAQKRSENIFGVKRAEIYVTVIADDSGQGSYLQLTDNAHAEDDADRLRSTCASTPAG